MHRWSLTLAAYQYNIVFKYTSQHRNANAMSGLPLYTTHGETPILAETSLLMEHLNRPPLSAVQVREWTRHDPVLVQVLQLVQDGWPEHGHEKELQPFASRSTGLSVQDSCLLWGNWVIMPPLGRQQILNELHCGHLGVARMKSLARICLVVKCEWTDWIVWHCSACQQNHASPLKAPLHPWEWPSKLGSSSIVEDHMHAPCDHWCPFEMDWSIWGQISYVSRSHAVFGECLCKIWGARHGGVRQWDVLCKLSERGEIWEMWLT